MRNFIKCFTVRLTDLNSLSQPIWDAFPTPLGRTMLYGSPAIIRGLKKNEIDTFDLDDFQDDDPGGKLVQEVIRDDKLRRLERELTSVAHNSILTAAKLIAPAIDTGFSAGNEAKY